MTIFLTTQIPTFTLIFEFSLTILEFQLSRKSGTVTLAVVTGPVIRGEGRPPLPPEIWGFFGA